MEKPAMKSQALSTRALLALICALAWPTIVEEALATVVQYAD